MHLPGGSQVQPGVATGQNLFSQTRLPLPAPCGMVLSMNDLDNYKMPRLGKEIARAFLNLARAVKASLPKRDGRVSFRVLRVLNWFKHRYIWVLIAIAVFAFGELWFELIQRLRLNLFDAVINSGEAMEAKESPEHLRAYAIVIAATATALIAIATAPFALLKAWVNERLADNAEQGHITERMTKAIEQLGAEKTVYRAGEANTEPNLEVRLGAIYALERIAQDSERDHIPIMETLCAYIRQNASEGEAKDFVLEDWLEGERKNAGQVTRNERNIARTKWIESLGPVRPLRDDVRTALSVIERRTVQRKAHERAATPPFRIDLTRANLQRVSLSDVDLTDANVYRARLEGASLDYAKLEGASFFAARLDSANLSWAKMNGADLRAARLNAANLRWTEIEGANLFEAELEEADIYAARLTGASLMSVTMTGASLFAAKLDGANFYLADLKGVDVRETDLRGVSSLTLNQINSMLRDERTMLPQELEATNQ